MKNLKVILMAALLLTLFSGKVFAVDIFGQASDSLNDAFAKVDTAISRTWTTGGKMLDIGTSVGGVVCTQAAKTILPATLFVPTFVGAGIADAVKTGITGVNDIVTDFKKSDFRTKILGPGKINTQVNAGSLASANQLGGTSSFPKMTTPNFTKSNLKGLDSPLVFNNNNNNKLY